MTVIAFSRGTLAGAAALAEQAAAELKIPCISREVIVEAARDAGDAEDVLIEQMDRPPTFFNRFSRERDVYLWHIRSAPCDHAAAGSFIDHGHGGNLSPAAGDGRRSPSAVAGPSVAMVRNALAVPYGWIARPGRKAESGEKSAAFRLPPSAFERPSADLRKAHFTPLTV